MQNYSRFECTDLRTLTILVLISIWPYSALAQLADSELSFVNTVETFNDTFKHPPVWREGGVKVDDSIKPLSDPSFSWAAGYIWNHPIVGTVVTWPPARHNYPAWTSNHNADADPNGDMIARISKDVSPLTWSGTLNFTARPMPSNLDPTIDKDDPHGYLSASIVSFPYAQLYGIFAISAKLPSGKGIWPAFWLLPANKAWPPEIDIFEMLGSDPTTFYTTVHTKGPTGHTSKGVPTHTQIDLSKDFHEYTVDWGPEQIRWYFDRKLVFTQPTPPDLHIPCYIVTNLAVGQPNDWGGAPDASTKFPATMQVASIKVWQRNTYSQALP
jgi:Glycosyl hydrolases family 16